MHYGSPIENSEIIQNSIYSNLKSRTTMASSLSKITLHKQIHQIREHRPVEIYKEWNQHNITITLKKIREK